MIATTLRGALKQYTLYRTLAAGTIAWYSRVVSVYCHWAGGDVPLAEFNGDSISQMLVAKEQAGRSPYYLKSLRGGLVAFYREIREGQPIERIRSIRTPPLDPHGLMPHEIERLVRACDIFDEPRRSQMRLMIILGYYTGLDAVDIWKLERRHFGQGGRLWFRRGKTGNPIFVRLPPDAMALIDKACPGRGQLVRLGVSRERFRQLVVKIYDKARLRGTFKTLRKSAGSLVERRRPGTGHKHLGNSRGVFDKHYDVKRITRSSPTMSPKIRLG